MRILVSLFVCFFTLSSLAQRAPNPTETNISYGKHERNKLDFWQAKSSKPTPVLIYFHGGAFKMGDKNNIKHFFSIKDYLAMGVSCISVNYPFLKHTNNNYQAILEHCEDSLAFIKKNSSKWNIDTKRISAAGTSAGALISQYLGFKGNDLNAIGAFMQPMGTEFFVLPNIKKNSPPILIYQQNPLTDKVHHPKYAKMVKDTCDKKKSECILWGTGKNGIEKIPKGKSQKAVMMDFFKAKWGMK